MTPSAPDLSRKELFSLVDERREAVHRYLQWAVENEQRAEQEGGSDLSMRMENRPDLRDAAGAAQLFAEQWWGLVVFTCFGSKLGAETVAPHFQRPLAPRDAVATLDSISFPRRSVGHHRIQSTLTGAKQALESACAHNAFFEEVLHSDEDFDRRYRRMREAQMRQWGRTTCFDLLLRAGALAVDGKRYLPELAYLAGSAGPRKGFAAVFGVTINKETAPWGEAVLKAWVEDWHAVAERVGVEWEGEALYPRDQENFLCIYQERL